jgi:predicted 3-demethylubiquinone-9 3-methyltransferase (glyoxalase superfamily)
LRAQSICQCFWYDNNGSEAAEWYCQLFDGTSIISQNPVVTEIALEGSRIMTLNGGTHFKPSSAMSNFVYIGGDVEKFEKIYNALSEEGRIIMPKATYEWSKLYAWVKDKYGVDWQLDIDSINNSQKLCPSLLFVNDKKSMVKSALEHYISIFSESRMIMEWAYPTQIGDMPEGSLLFGQCKIGPTIINAMSSTEEHDYDFTAGNSLVVVCKTQEEIDYFWKSLGVDGKFKMCGWLEDKFGVSWQIIPDILAGLMIDPVLGPKASEALLKMNKIKIAGLY